MSKYEENWWMNSFKVPPVIPVHFFLHLFSKIPVEKHPIRFVHFHIWVEIGEPFGSLGLYSSVLRLQMLFLRVTTTDFNLGKLEFHIFSWQTGYAILNQFLLAEDHSCTSFSVLLKMFSISVLRIHYKLPSFWELLELKTSHHY